MSVYLRTKLGLFSATSVCSHNLSRRVLNGTVSKGQGHLLVSAGTAFPVKRSQGRVKTSHFRVVGTYRTDLQHLKASCVSVCCVRNFSNTAPLRRALDTLSGLIRDKGMHCVKYSGFSN